MSAWVTWFTLGSWSRVFDYGIGAGNHNLLVAHRGGTKHLFVRSGLGDKVNDY